jgi:hypothetical protein
MGMLSDTELLLQAIWIGDTVERNDTVIFWVMALCIDSM